MNLFNETIYQVYIRNHTKEGTFKAFIADLPRIKQLGISIIHLLPIHPIGEKSRKGKEGCPYAISDYRSINPKYGSLEDFLLLLDKAHSLNMKILLDVVFNHTSPDSILIKEHPEWFHKNANGEFSNKFGDWTDIRDLEFKDQRLNEYLIQILEYWANIGVDGFRCDVASLIPMDFWYQAKKAIAKFKPDLIWVAESVDLSFIKMYRNSGYVSVLDYELYDVFDIIYQHDIWPILEGYMLGNRKLLELKNFLYYQDTMYKLNANKLRFLENHDRARFASYGLNTYIWHAMLFFLRGTSLLYGGQEFSDPKRPSLFELDPIQTHLNDLQPFLKKLIALKKMEFFSKGQFNVECDGHLLHMYYNLDGKQIHGLFQLRPETTLLSTKQKVFNILTEQFITIESKANLTEPVIYIV